MGACEFVEVFSALSIYRSSKSNYVYHVSFQPNRNFFGLFQKFYALPGAPWIHIKEVRWHSYMICVQFSAWLDSFLRAAFVALAALLIYTNFENQFTASILFLKPQRFVLLQVVSFVPPSRTLLLFLESSSNDVEDYLSGLQKHRTSCFLWDFRLVSAFFLPREMGHHPLSLWIDKPHEV